MDSHGKDAFVLVRIQEAKGAALDELAYETFRHHVEEEKDRLRRERKPWWRRIFNYRLSIQLKEKQS